MTQRAFFGRLNTFCSSFWVAKLPAAPAAPRAADLANFLPAPLAKDRPTFLPTIFNTGNKAPKTPAPLCLLLRPRRTTLVMSAGCSWSLGFFILSSQGIQGLGHGPQEFEEKIAAHLGSPWGSPLGSDSGSPKGWRSDTAFAAFLATHSFDFWHDVTDRRVSSPFIVRKDLWVGQSRVRFGTCWASV